MTRPAYYIFRPAADADRSRGRGRRGRLYPIIENSMGAAFANGSGPADGTGLANATGRTVQLNIIFRLSANTARIARQQNILPRALPFYKMAPAYFL